MHRYGLISSLCTGTYLNNEVTYFLEKDWLDPGVGGVDGDTILVIGWVASDATSTVSV